MGVVQEEQAAAKQALRDAVHGEALAENEMRDALERARAAKVAVTEIARIARISRTTLYRRWGQP